MGPEVNSRPPALEWTDLRPHGRLGLRFQVKQPDGGGVGLRRPDQLDRSFWVMRTPSTSTTAKITNFFIVTTLAPRPTPAYDSCDPRAGPAVAARLPA
jgi:hypothetical protein